MLVLSRKNTETVVIKSELMIDGVRVVERIVVTILEVKGGRVKLGVDAPDGHIITREPR